MTLVAALTLTRSPIAAFDAGPALPAFAVGAVNVRVDLFLADLTGHGLVGVVVSLLRRTRSVGTTSFSTTGRSSCRTTSCSSSLMSGPDLAAPTLASVIGSRSTRISSWLTGTVLVTFSVTTYFAASPAAFTLLRADPEPLLRDGHRLVGPGAGRMPLLAPVPVLVPAAVLAPVAVPVARAEPRWSAGSTNVKSNSGDGKVRDRAAVSGRSPPSRRAADRRRR